MLPSVGATTTSNASPFTVKISEANFPSLPIRADKTQKPHTETKGKTIGHIINTNTLYSKHNKGFSLQLETEMPCEAKYES